MIHACMYSSHMLLRPKAMVYVHLQYSADRQKVLPSCRHDRTTPPRVASKLDFRWPSSINSDRWQFFRKRSWLILFLSIPIFNCCRSQQPTCHHPVQVLQCLVFNRSIEDKTRESCCDVPEVTDGQEIRQLNTD